MAGAVRIPGPENDQNASNICFVVLAGVVSSVLGCGFQREATNALDDIRDSLGDVATRYGDVVHVRRIHSHSAVARNRNSTDPNHSRSSATIRRCV